MSRTVSRETDTPLPAKSARKKPSLAKSDGKASAKILPKHSGGARAKTGFPVVGIGASVGGLVAFRELLAHLPADTGMAFVLVQHLDPLHKSALSELLGPSSSIPVEEVTRDTRVQPNHVYVIPPNCSLTFEKGALKLRPRPPSVEGHRTIDTFFESLARARQAGAIGIILSGAANDGTLGLEAIRAEGGITFAQDQSAKNESMPRSAIAAGVVDFVLSPAKIAVELGRIAGHPFLHATPVFEPEEFAATSGKKVAPGKDGEATEAANSAAKKILALLARHSGVDFTCYKSSTIQRRIRRRMVLSRLGTLEEYAERLKDDRAELELLYADVLIHVTSFFRNPETFEYLKAKVLPKLFQRAADATVRIWVAGCATGQEAYSIAMLLSEVASRYSEAPAFQIFATDLNASVLETARTGLYAKSAVEDVSPTRLRRFFLQEHSGYRVTKTLRDVVVFAQHNVLRDPPFSRMDLISCRNLLIYLEPSLQQKVFPTFHYALKPEGILFLGAAESVSVCPTLFEPAAKLHKLFLRKTGSSPQMHFTPRAPVAKNEDRAPIVRTPPPEHFRGDIDMHRESDRVTLSRYAPCSVLINADQHVLQFRGDTSLWLRPPIGRASFEILKMAQPGLVAPLRTVLAEAKKSQANARSERVQMEVNGQKYSSNIEVIPLKNLKERCYLVFFEAATHPKFSPPGAISAAFETSEGVSVTPQSREGLRRKITALRHELSERSEFIQSFQEQAEAVHEEFQAAHEEVTSGNEELQSVNEELESSKEEIESANEELITVNDELASRIAAMARLNDDLTNLQTSVQLAVVLLGRDQSIRRFSEKAGTLFNLIITDIGRPFSHVRHNLHITDFDAVIGEVIRTFRNFEREVQSLDERWYSLQVRPYVSTDQRIDGAVVVLLDIDAIKRGQQQTAKARDYAQAIIRAAPEPLVVLTPDLLVETANPAFYRMFKVPASAMEGKLIYELGDGHWSTPAVHRLIDDVLLQAPGLDDCEVTRDFEHIGRRTMVLNARLLGDASPAKILLGIRDITVFVNIQAEIRRSELRYRRLFEAARDGVLIIDPATRRIVDANPFMSELLGYTHSELIGKELFELGLLQDHEASRAAYHELEQRGFIRFEHLPLRSKTGESRDVEMVNTRYEADGLSVIQCNIRDITARKQADYALRNSEERYRALFNSIDEGFCIIDMIFNLEGTAIDYRFVEVNPAFAKHTGMNAVLGKRMLEINPTHERHWFDAYGAVALTGKSMRIVNTSKGLGGRWFDAFAFRLASGGLKLGVIFTDITAKRAADALERYHGELLSTLSETATHLLTADSPRFLLDVIFTSAARVLGAEYCFVHLAGAENSRFTLEHANGLNPAQRATFSSLSFDIGAGGALVAGPEAFPLNFETIERALENAAVVLQPTVFQCHPLKAGGRMLGTLTIVSSKRGAFDKSELQFVYTLCDVVAASLERARLTGAVADARDASERANVAKDMFLAALSHELRTPLGPVLLLAGESADDPAMPANARDAFATIVKNVKLEARLIDDLLDVTRITHGKLALDFNLVDVHVALRDAIETVQAEMEDKRIALTLNFTSTRVLISGDPVRLQQIFWNVLRNAVKFSPDKGQIVIATEVVGDDLIRISVTDRGIGIAAQELKRLFTAFSQGDHADGGGSHRFGGLGLGLSISRKLVELHGGKITAESPGIHQGSTFIVDLPIERAALSEAESVTRKKPGSKMHTADEPEKLVPLRRILVVEDHEHTRTALTQLLVRRNYEVSSAGSVAEAQAAVAASKPFDLLISDLGLPDGSGLELMADLKARFGLTGIALTGYGRDEDVFRSRVAGFITHLIKPVSIQSLETALAAAAVAKT